MRKQNKNQIATELKNSNCDTKYQIATKLGNSSCDYTQKLKF